MGNWFWTTRLWLILREAYGAWGITQITYARGWTSHYGGGEVGGIEIAMGSAHRTIPMQYTHIVADFWMWEMVEP